jgi:DNA-binding response OmpR family regulator
MKKILLIEDNTEVRENTSEILSLANYDVVTAKNGKEGAELAQKLLPDLIICDIMMPELDGYGVLHILGKKAETAGIPFIFLTAKAEKTDMRKGMNLGADDYLTKPFDDTELLNAIETRLRKIDQIRRYDATPEGLDQFIKDAGKVLHLNDLGKDRKTKTYKKKMEIFAEGDIPANIYLVKSGNVKVFKSHPDGKELITNLYKSNDYFGFESILENTNYGETAVTLEDSELIIIPKHDLLSFMYGSPEIARAFVSMLCKKVEEKESQLLNLAYNSVRQRTAEALLKVYKLRESEKKLSISRDDLSKMVGTAAESVIRVLSEFKEEGHIEIESGKIQILQPAKLEKVVRWNVAR